MFLNGGDVMGQGTWVKGRFSDPFPSLLGLLIRKQY